MPLNRATLIRISTIDKCLQNHYRRWTINDLIDACTDALAEYEGRSNPVSRRTFQNDLALMRSDRLGYNAPIVVRDNKYYEYEDPDYSITHLPLNDEGLDALNSALDILRQLQGFPQLASSIDIISKLNEQISRQTGSTTPAMDLEHVAGYKGAQFIGTIYDAVRKQRTSVLQVPTTQGHRGLPLSLKRISEPLVPHLRKVDKSFPTGQYIRPRPHTLGCVG